MRIVRPLIPLWVLPVLALLCVLTLIGGGIGLKMYTDWGTATATAQTATVVAATTLTAQADSDEDGITDLEEIKLGTDPNKADTDGDGLDDKQEASYRTDPLIADTDGDGLIDGDEISEGANPLAKDSDGDTWLDGQEVHQTHTSPINPDTDGDGANDNVDPDPGQLPTPTITPNATATAQSVAATATQAAANAAATATTMADAAAATQTKAALDAAATTGAINAAMTQQAGQDAQTREALSAAATAQAASDQQTKVALGATLTAEAQKPVPTATPAYVPFVVGGNLNSAMKWDRGGSTSNKNGFYTGKMYITSAPKMNQWGETNTAPAVLYKVSGDFDAQVLLEFNPPSGAFSGMGVQRTNDEEWWLRAGRIKDALVVDIGKGGSSSKVKSITFKASQVYLKIVKRNDVFYFYYSSDAKVWQYLYGYKMTQSSSVNVYFTTFSWGSSTVSSWFSDFRIAAR